MSIIIENSDGLFYQGTSLWRFNASIVTTVPPVDPPTGGIEDLNFSPSVTLNNNGGIWSGGVQEGFAKNYGIATRKLAAGQEGYIEFRHSDSNAEGAILAFNTSDSPEGYGITPNGNYEAAIFISGGAVYKIDGGNVSSTGWSVVINNYYRIYRFGSVLKVQTSSDYNSWTDLNTFTFTSNGDLYINLNINNLGKCYYPRGFNLSNLDGGGNVQPPINTDNLNIVVDGNSYTQGNLAIGDEPFPTHLMRLSPFNTNGATMTNFGVGGQTTAQMIVDEQSQVFSAFNPSKVNVLLVVEGGNDIYYNGNVPNCFNNYKIYCNAARAKGFKVIVSTTIPREQSTFANASVYEYNEQLKQFNTLVINDTSFYDGIIRPDADPLFSNWLHYESDHVHPDNVGQQKFAQLFASAILTL